MQCGIVSQFGHTHNKNRRTGDQKKGCAVAAEFSGKALYMSGQGWVAHGGLPHTRDALAGEGGYRHERFRKNESGWQG